MAEIVGRSAGSYLAGRSCASSQATLSSSYDMVAVRDGDDVLSDAGSTRAKDGRGINPYCSFQVELHHSRAEMFNCSNTEFPIITNVVSSTVAGAYV